MDYFYIQWHITDRCNLRCLHCYQENYSFEGELDLKRLKIISDNIILAMKKWGKKLNIAITGGEPLIKNETLSIMKYLNEFNEVSETNLITNGTLLMNFIDDFVKLKKFKKLFISLDGVTAETNDSIRGKGNFSKTIDIIKHLKNYKLKIILMWTLMQRNFKDAKKIIEFGQNLGIDGVIIEKFIPIGVGKKIKNEAITKEKLKEFYKYILNKCGADTSDNYKYRALQIKFNKKISLQGAVCIVGKDGIGVLPDGTVLPCRRFYIPIGNLLQQSLTEIWASSIILNQVRDRSKLKGKCAICNIEDCYGCRAMSMALTGEYLSEDVHCWR